MDLINELKGIYNNRIPIERKCLDLCIETFFEIDSNKLSTDKNQTFILNENVLTISLQHKNNNDRRLLLVFQNGFVEIQVGYYVKTYYYENFIGDILRIKEFKAFLLLILDTPYKQIDYSLNGTLIKYSLIWNDKSVKIKTIYTKPFGRIIEMVGKKRNYETREILAESFLK